MIRGSEGRHWLRRATELGWAVALGGCLGVILFTLAGAASAQTCASASLRHEAPSAWAGYSCADIDDLVAASDTLAADARNLTEKWSDLGLAFVAVVFAALAALAAQAIARSVIAVIDSLRPARDSPFFLSQFHGLTKKRNPSQNDAQVLRAMATVISGGSVARALYALVFALIYLALLVG